MKSIIILFTSILLLGCDTPNQADGTLEVFNDFKVMISKKKFFVIGAGDQKTTMTVFPSKFNFKIKDNEGRDRDVTLKFPKTVINERPDNFDDDKVRFKIDGNELSRVQKFDIEGDFIVKTEIIDEWSHTYSCSYTTYSEYCEDQCSYVDGRMVCRDVCVRVPRTNSGTRTDSTWTEVKTVELNYEIVSKETDEVLAKFSGKREKREDKEYDSGCH